MEWGKFTFDLHLEETANLMGNLISIEAYKESAMNLVLPPDWHDQLDRLNRIRAVHGTTALEGNPLSEAEVAHQIDIAEQPGETAELKATREQQQIRNAGRAQDWVRKRFTPQCAPMEISDMQYMHKLITEASDETHNVPGQFRTFPVTVGTPGRGGVHKGAPHDDVPRLMNEYIEIVNPRS